MRILCGILLLSLLLAAGCWQFFPPDNSDLPQYTLTVTVDGQGSVSPETQTYPAGTVVKLTATPEDAWQFDHWSGAAIGITNTTLITMDKDKEVTAVFKESSNPKVRMKTTLGDIVIELYPKQAPATVANFLQYVTSGFYDGRDGNGATIFHRVIPDFVIQGGGLTADLTQKQTNAPIVNEANNGLKNLRGTIAMARTSDPNSATSQFFINLVDNPSLDYVEGQNAGYAVFGEVVEGMDVVDKIAEVETHTVGQYQDVPVDPITITSAALEEE